MQNEELLQGANKEVQRLMDREDTPEWVKALCHTILTQGLDKDARVILLIMIVAYEHGSLPIMVRCIAEFGQMSAMIGLMLNV